jgi:hypothetical protein
MGKKWDRLDWTDGGGMMGVGMGGREIPWPSYSGTGAAGTANATCATCGGRMRGGNKCSCDKPDWRVKGQPLNLSANAERMQKQQHSHRIGLNEAFRVLRPGGVIKAFSGTRTFHRMAAAMAEAGFVDLRIESWNYGSGFPKSMNISKKMDRRGGVSADREAFYQHLKSRREAAGLSRTEVTERVTGQRTGSCWNWEHFSLPEPRFWPALRDLLGLDPAWESLIVGAEREVIEKRTMIQGGGTSLMIRQGERKEVEANITAPATTPAHQWKGWGTALKPSWEPVVVGRKPDA